MLVAYSFIYIVVQPVLKLNSAIPKRIVGVFEKGTVNTIFTDGLFAEQLNVTLPLYILFSLAKMGHYGDP